MILLQDIPGVGKRNEVKDVADGYALNFLIPRTLAAQATPERLASHQMRMAEQAALKREEVDMLAKAIQSLENATITLKLRATEKGGLFRAITAKDIAKAIEDQRGAKLPAEAVLLEKPIKTLGEYKLAIKAGAEAHITVNITA